MMQTAVFIGNAVGPFFGGMAADAFGYRVSFRVGALLTVLGGVMVYLGTRENFTPAGRGSVSSARSLGFREILLLPGFLMSVGVLFAVRFSNNIANPSFPLIVRDMVDNVPHFNSITGGVIAAAALAAACSAALLGHVGDRIGRRRVLVGCCLGACLASVGHYYSRDLPLLVASRILFGFTVAGMMPAANASIHAVVDGRAIGKAYGLATSLSMLGTAIGPTLGGFLAMRAGLRFPFLVTAVAQVGLAILVLLFLRENRVAVLKTPGTV